ncbi:MAG: putative toxin-antitoxin system toxin component, PIN family [Fibrobacterota bacterium]
MKAVLDTNVLLSAFLFGGKPRQLIERALEGRLALYTSPALLTEIRNTLARSKFMLSPALATIMMEELEQLVTLVYPSERIHRACRDTKDHIVLECACESRCHAIVSGDNDLLVMKQFRGIPILRVAECLDRLV